MASTIAIRKRRGSSQSVRAAVATYEEIRYGRSRFGTPPTHTASKKPNAAATEINIAFGKRPIIHARATNDARWVAQRVAGPMSHHQRGGPSGPPPQDENLSPKVARNTINGGAIAASG